ncbi:MAG: hypothetical protein R2867_01515 [Caldilineaceae bacterium]
MTVDGSRLSQGIFVINATFRNQSGSRLDHGFFNVTELAYQTGELAPAGLVVQNAIGGPKGKGALVEIPAVLEAGATFAVSFEINLPRIEPFDFFVDAYGLPSGEIVAAVQQVRPCHRLN